MLWSKYRVENNLQRCDNCYLFQAMHYLGIPTTRGFITTFWWLPYTLVFFSVVAGSCITSDSKVVRDIFYNGNSITERATVISRIAPSFLRYFTVFMLCLLYVTAVLHNVCGLTVIIINCITILLHFLLCCRFGSFEIFKTQDPVTMCTGPSVGMDDFFFQLVDYTIQSYYPEVHVHKGIDFTVTQNLFWEGKKVHIIMGVLF